MIECFKLSGLFQQGFFQWLSPDVGIGIVSAESGAEFPIAPTELVRLIEHLEIDIRGTALIALGNLLPQHFQAAGQMHIRGTVHLAVVVDIEDIQPIDFRRRPRQKNRASRFPARPGCWACDAKTRQRISVPSDAAPPV